MNTEPVTPETTTPAITAPEPPDLSPDQPPCGSAEFGVGGFFPHLEDSDEAEPER